MSRESAAIQCDLMKLLRGMWLSRAEIQGETGWPESAVNAWCEEMESQGMLRSASAKRVPGQWGPAPRVYTLSARWGGME
jgi:DNA-binding IclR family transcriptional regulator